MSTSAARIFINYRRSDSAGWARQVADDLGARFGTTRVFRDVAIEPGIDFVEHIERVMNSCEVCIVVIGPSWIDVRNADGRRRLDDPSDLVRREIERALERPDVRVMPILVQGARMPTAHELPDGLRALARINASELSDSRWEYDIERLCQHLHPLLGDSTAMHAAAPSGTPQAAESSPVQAAAPARAASGALAVAGATICAAAVAAQFTRPLTGDGSAVGPDRIVEYGIERGVLWALVGAVVAAVAAIAFAHARMPIGAALAGAGAGLAGGAIGAAMNRVLADYGAIDTRWLLSFVLLAAPALALAKLLSRHVSGREGECLLAALAGAALAAAVAPHDRTWRLVLHALIVVGAIVAVLATPGGRVLAAGRVALQRGAGAGAG